MFLRGVAGDMIRHFDQGQLHLQRTGAKQTGDLGLGPDLVRHQIQQTDLERPHVLADGVRLAHDHNALGFKRGEGWKIVRNLDRHLNVPCYFNASSRVEQTLWRDPFSCRFGHIFQKRSATLLGEQVGVERRLNS